ncbi:very-long-chain acyl-CoA synthetase family protein (CefD1), putative [Talaromyces stipitatus ATCC 10500]|uniref:Very long-chain fatty acid transport protein n=1 Tax=Talaromyces stipitatus (strain ATCC 10500 / CBS 375.48 / QM 6759 / NRRL 1006) TaxID=441959 RepID=B8M4M5_TALSN|nr:very-long-chain acyl-CoA synthetase family protein (CefD1), putative [Talaromyces stipitatus ATCC 10500]EED19220.1 very-long-chain acyl-CoA synthetase family protein (CefD1), putative [Talaromyces stipitatus ATCC 10500]
MNQVTAPLVAAAVAGTATAAAYINAKWHISNDIKNIWTVKSGEWAVKRAIANARLNIFFLFEDTATKYPDKVAIWSRERSYTYRETLEISSQLAHYFLSIGVQPEQLVAVYLMNSPEFIFIWLALMSIGCAPAGINYNLNGDGLTHCLKVPNSAFVIVDDDAECRERIESVRPILENDLNITILSLSEVMQKAGEFPRSTPDEKYRLNVKPSFPLMLIYTSGTTGLPKGCAFTTSRFYAGASVARPTQDRWYCCMPLYHGTGAIWSLARLVSGTSIAIGRKFSASNFWNDVRDSESTWFIYVGETVRYLLNNPPSPQDKEHKIYGMLGNGLRPDVWERFQQRFGVQEINEFFNSTEGMLGLMNVNRGPFTTGAVGHHGLLLRLHYQNQYIPVAIDHETGDIWRDPKTGFAKRQAYEEGGEILVAVPSKEAFQGYWKNNTATSKKFAQDVFRKGDLYYRSGDALRRTSDGRWYFIDRLGDTFRWKSENVSTAEVAETIGRYPGVTEANVYGVLVPNHEGRAGCAALDLSVRETEFDWKTFARFVCEKLPRYAVPVFLRVTRKGARHTHNNKQNKVPLRQEGVDPALKGTKDVEGANDRLLWLSPAGDEYVDFGQREWDLLVAKEARL